MTDHHAARTVGFSIILVLALGTLIRCSGRHSDIEKVMRANMAIMAQYVDDLQKADSPELVAAAIQRYAANVRKLQPQQSELRAKYPDLVGIRQRTEELRDLNDQYAEWVSKVNLMSQRIAPFQADPAVKAAQQDLIQAWIEGK